MGKIGAGRQLVKVVSHQLGESKTGTPHVAVLFEDGQGDRLTWYGYLSDAALERTVNSLAILGWDPTKHDGRVDSLNGTGILAGNEAEIVVELEEYNGAWEPKVKWVNQIGGMGKGLDADGAKDMAAKLRQRILSAPRPQANTKPAAARQPAAAAAGRGKPLTEHDDDLPF